MPPRDPLGLVGTRVRDTYDVVECVSHGGLSVVYRAIHTSGDRIVALKCLYGLADLPAPVREQFQNNFLHVGRLIARLAKHQPGLCRTHGIGTAPVGPGRDVPCMILEWLDGVSLEAVLDRARAHGYIARSPADVLNSMRAPMQALAAAHEHGVVHRDIKPSNIFVCGDDLAADVPVKMLDFSLAKIDSEQYGPSDGVTFMAPNYAAPEQFAGDEAAIGPWTDVFGFGLVLVELLVGGFQALPGDDMSALRQASEDPAERPTPRHFGVDVPNPVEAVLKRALAVDPSRRFENMRRFADAFEAAVTAEGRVTSTGISRVSGVLDVDTNRRRPPTSATSDSGVSHPPARTGETVVNQRAPAQTGQTVIAPPPRREPKS